MKVLVLTFPLLPIGGGSALGAWTLQALKDAHEVDVLCWRNSDLARVNLAYGTSLRTDEFRWHRIPGWLRMLINAMPTRLSLLEMMLVNRFARRLVARGHYDMVLSTVNEIDVGQLAIQYVHFPWRYFPRPGWDPADHRWYHLTALVRGYRRFASFIGDFNQERSRHNRSLANSRWTAERFFECYGMRPEVLYPPVLTDFPEIPFARKLNVFACLGRISEDKEVPKLVEIVRRIRAEGFEFGLRIIGGADSPGLVAALHAEAQREPWLSLHVNLPRDELVRAVAECRFGLHGKRNEHFGIAPAELQLAGCVTFVPDDGGAVEIVGAEPALVYGSVDEAVEKILAVLRDSALEQRLRARLQQTQHDFSCETFVARVRALVVVATEKPTV